MDELPSQALIRHDREVISKVFDGIDGDFQRFWKERRQSLVRHGQVSPLNNFSTCFHLRSGYWIYKVIRRLNLIVGATVRSLGVILIVHCAMHGKSSRAPFHIEKKNILEKWLHLAVVSSAHSPLASTNYALKSMSWKRWSRLGQVLRKIFLLL